MYVMLFILCVKESRRLNVDPMIELPLIGYLCLREELWDRVGQTFQVAGSKCIAKSCFEVQKKLFWREIHAFPSSSFRNF